MIFSSRICVAQNKKAGESPLFCFSLVYLQSVQSFVLLLLLDFVSFCFVSVQWQSLGCFFVACLLVETDFAMFILLFFRLSPFEDSMAQNVCFHTLRGEKIMV